MILMNQLLTRRPSFFTEPLPRKGMETLPVPPAAVDDPPFTEPLPRKGMETLHESSNRKQTKALQNRFPARGWKHDHNFGWNTVQLYRTASPPGDGNNLSPNFYYRWTALQNRFPARGWKYWGHNVELIPKPFTEPLLCKGMETLG